MVKIRGESEYWPIRIAFQTTPIVFTGKCPRCGTVNDCRGVMHGDEPHGRLAIPREVKCFNCGLGCDTLIVDECVNAKGEYLFRSAELVFRDFCRCECHERKGVRCGFMPCCGLAGEVYAEKWPEVPKLLGDIGGEIP